MSAIEKNAKEAAGIGQPTPDTPMSMPENNKTASENKTSTHSVGLHKEYEKADPLVSVANTESDLSGVKAENEKSRQEAIDALKGKVDETEKAYQARLKELEDTKFLNQKEADERTRYSERIGKGLYRRYKEGEIDKKQFATMLADHLGTSLQNMGEFFATNHSSNKQSEIEQIQQSDLDAALERRKKADDLPLSEYLDNAGYSKEQMRKLTEQNAELMRNEDLKPIMNRLSNEEKVQLFELDAEFGNVLVKHPELASLVARAQKSGDKDFIREQLAAQNAHDLSIDMMHQGVDISAEQAKALADVQMMTNEQRAKFLQTPEGKELANLFAIYQQYESGNSTANQNLQRANQAVGVGSGVVNIFGKIFGAPQ